MFASEDNLTLKQYERCIAVMANYDYPQKWPNLIVDIVNALNAGNEKGTLTGLKALLMLVKKYEFEANTKREPLY